MVQRLLKAAAEKFSMPLRIVYEAQSIPAMRTLVVRGAAASFMPYGTAIEELRAGELVMQRISDLPLKRTLYLIKPSGGTAFRQQDAIDRFLASVTDHLLESSGPARASSRRLIVGQPYGIDLTLIPGKSLLSCR